VCYFPSFSITISDQLVSPLSSCLILQGESNRSVALSREHFSTPTRDGDHSASLRDGPSGQHGCAPNDKACLALALPASRSFPLALCRSSFVSRWSVFSFASLWTERKKRPTGQTKEKTMEYHSNNNTNGNGSATAQQLIRDNVRYLIEQLEAGHNETLTAYLNAMANFHTYSFGNVLLIARQRPQATHVAGIRTWNELGRRVKRGEKGIAILAPMIGKRRKKENTDTGTEEEANTSTLLGFRRVFVWDELQTDGAPLPTIGEVTGEAGVYLDRLRDFVQAQGIALEYNESIAPAFGMSYGGRIALLPGQTKAEEFSVLVHEVAHERIHKSERRKATTKVVRETEAEAVAFVVSKAIGLNPKSSTNYIQLYHGNAELLMESLEVVQQTSAVILGAITMEEPAPAEAQKQQTAPDHTPEAEDAGYSPAPADFAEAATPAA
jgi:antirestriction protein ArdC